MFDCLQGISPWATCVASHRPVESLGYRVLPDRSQDTDSINQQSTQRISSGGPHAKNGNRSTLSDTQCRAKQHNSAKRETRESEAKLIKREGRRNSPNKVGKSRRPVVGDKPITDQQYFNNQGYIHPFARSASIVPVWALQEIPYYFKHSMHHTYYMQIYR